MASLVLGVAGAAIGSIFGMPQLGYMVGSALGAALFPPPGQDGPRITDLKVQSSQYGNMIPIVYNTCRVAGTVIWADDLIEHKQKMDSGSGGGGPTEYTYTCSFAVSVCMSHKVVRRIWADGKLIYSRLTGEQQFKATSIAFYAGDEEQFPDPTIEAKLGSGNVPGYRGQCYIVIADMELGKYGNRVPNLTFEVVPPEDAEVMTLGEIIEDLSIRCGLTYPELNASELTETVRGYSLATVMTGRSAIEPLAVAYFFDAVESDATMKFVRKGTNPILTINSGETLLKSN